MFTQIRSKITLVIFFFFLNVNKEYYCFVAKVHKSCYKKISKIVHLKKATEQRRLFLRESFFETLNSKFVQR